MPSPPDSLRQYQALLQSRELPVDALSIVRANMSNGDWPVAAASVDPDRAAGAMIGVGVGYALGRSPTTPSSPCALPPRSLGQSIRRIEDGTDYRMRNRSGQSSLSERLVSDVPDLLAAGATASDANDRLWSGAYVLESLPSALFCFLSRPDEPIEAVRDSVNWSRDSDTTGAITGSFAGAYCGISAFAGYWRDELEFGDELEALGRKLVSL